MEIKVGTFIRLPNISKAKKVEIPVECCDRVRTTKYCPECGKKIKTKKVTQSVSITYDDILGDYADNFKSINLGSSIILYSKLDVGICDNFDDTDYNSYFEFDVIENETEKSEFRHVYHNEIDILEKYLDKQIDVLFGVILI